MSQCYLSNILLCIYNISTTTLLNTKYIHTLGILLQNNLKHPILLTIYELWLKSYNNTYKAIHLNN